MNPGVMMLRAWTTFELRLLGNSSNAKDKHLLNRLDPRLLCLNTFKMASPLSITRAARLMSAQPMRLTAMRQPMLQRRFLNLQASQRLRAVPVRQSKEMNCSVANH